MLAQVAAVRCHNHHVQWPASEPTLSQQTSNPWVLRLSPSAPVVSRVPSARPITCARFITEPTVDSLRFLTGAPQGRDRSTERYQSACHLDFYSSALPRTAHDRPPEGIEPASIGDGIRPSDQRPIDSACSPPPHNVESVRPRKGPGPPHAQPSAPVDQQDRAHTDREEDKLCGSCARARDDHRGWQHPHECSRDSETANPTSPTHLSVCLLWRSHLGVVLSAL